MQAGCALECSINVLEIVLAQQREPTIFEDAVKRVGGVVHRAPSKLPAVAKRRQLAAEIEIGKVDADERVVTAGIDPGVVGEACTDGYLWRFRIDQVSFNVSWTSHDVPHEPPRIHELIDLIPEIRIN